MGGQAGFGCSLPNRIGTEMNVFDDLVVIGPLTRPGFLITKISCLSPK